MRRSSRFLAFSAASQSCCARIVVTLSRSAAARPSPSAAIRDASAAWRASSARSSRTIKPPLDGELAADLAAAARAAEAFAAASASARPRLSISATRASISALWRSASARAGRRTSRRRHASCAVPAGSGACRSPKSPPARSLPALAGRLPRPRSAPPVSPVPTTAARHAGWKGGHSCRQSIWRSERQGSALR